MKVVIRHPRAKKPKFNYLKCLKLDKEFELELESRAGDKILKNFARMFVKIKKDKLYLLNTDKGVHWGNVGDYFLKEEVEKVLKRGNIPLEGVEIVPICLRMLESVPYKDWAENLQ